MKRLEAWDVRYEWRAVVLLMLAFGLVGLDRFAPNFLFPAMMKDLRLNYQDLGYISAVLALSWGVGSMLMGQVSDRLGRRKVIIPSVTVFSCVVGLTGFVNGMISLLALRVIMGLSEGAFMPASIAATIEASKPSRRGFNFGFQQNGLPVIGLGLGPIVATQLLGLTGSWRWTYVLIAIPGIVLAYLLYRVIRDTQGTVVGSAEEMAATGLRPRWSNVLRYRNVVLASLVLVFLAGSLNVVIAMTPSYLVEYMKVDSQRMGFIMSATGVGAFFGGISLPALSDRVGRKPVMLASVLAATLSLWLFMSAPADPVRLFLFLTGATGFAFSVIYINNGPLTVESVPASLSSTAVGLVVGLGEIIGGGIAPSVAGHIAKNYGIQHVFGIALSALIACAAIILFIREPRSAFQVLGQESTSANAG